MKASWNGRHSGGFDLFGIDALFHRPALARRHGHRAVREPEGLEHHGVVQQLQPGIDPVSRQLRAAEQRLPRHRPAGASSERAARCPSIHSAYC